MNRRPILALAVAAIGIGVLTNRTWKKRSLDRQMVAAISFEQVVDFGIMIRVVQADPNGVELLEGRPLMSVLRVHHFGGIVDTRMEPPQFVDHSKSPVIWTCSIEQEQIILHDDPDQPAQLIEGSEGAGKTTVLAQWQALMVVKHIGQRREGLQTAPTLKRLGLVRSEIERLWPKRWYDYAARKDFEGYELCDGTTIRMLSTHRQSEAQGSPVQGFNSSWAGMDEGQDQTEEQDNVTARLRAAKGGARRAPRLMTATVKNSTEYRDLKGKMKKSGLWAHRRLLGARSPFVWPEHWEAMKSGMSLREYRRRALAEDLGPERMQYPTWEREHNLIVIPEIGGPLDVTRRELQAWGGNFSLLVGHDPGTLFDVSIVLKAFQLPKQKLPFWVVVDEVTTEESTTEVHVAALLARMRARWGVNLLRHDALEDTAAWISPDCPKMLVRADPYGNNDAHPDRSVYTIFRNRGITIHPGAYNAAGEKPGRVPKEGGIDLVCTLLCDAAQERRLFVALDERGEPVAPRLVKTLEQSERDTDGEAETQRKDKKDLSHWGAALRYGLWVIERPRLKIVQPAPTSTRGTI